MAQLPEEVTNVFAAVGLLCVGVLTGVAAMLWRAWWLYPAWGWYLVPLGAPQVSFWHFAGLGYLLTFYTLQPDYKRDERRTNWPFVVGSSLVWPMIAWLVLWWMKS